MMNRSWFSFQRSASVKESKKPLVSASAEESVDTFKMMTAKLQEHETSLNGTLDTGNADDSLSDVSIGDNVKASLYHQLFLDESKRMRTVQVEVIESDISGKNDRVLLEHTGSNGPIAFEGADPSETEVSPNLHLPPQLVSTEIISSNITPQSSLLNDTIDSCSTMSGSFEDREVNESVEDSEEGFEQELDKYLAIVNSSEIADVRNTQEIKKGLSRRSSFVPRILSYRRQDSKNQDESVVKRNALRRFRTETAKSVSPLMSDNDTVTIIAPADHYSAAVSPVELTLDSVEDDISGRLAEI